MDESKKRGRPPKPEGEKLERRAMYLPLDVWAKIDAHCMDWMREVLRKASPPKS